jgi:hypothetical protein
MHSHSNVQFNAARTVIPPTLLIMLNSPLRNCPRQVPEGELKDGEEFTGSLQNPPTRPNSLGAQ